MIPLYVFLCISSCVWWNRIEIVMYKSGRNWQHWIWNGHQKCGFHKAKNRTHSKLVKTISVTHKHTQTYKWYKSTQTHTHTLQRYCICFKRRKKNSLRFILIWYWDMLKEFPVFYTHIIRESCIQLMKWTKKKARQMWWNGFGMLQGNIIILVGYMLTMVTCSSYEFLCAIFIFYFPPFHPVVWWCCLVILYRAY